MDLQNNLAMKLSWRSPNQISHVIRHPPSSPGLPRRFIDGVLPQDSAGSSIQYCSSGQSSPSLAGSATPVPTPRRESLVEKHVVSSSNMVHTAPSNVLTSPPNDYGSSSIPPPIACRPEKTKSIVSHFK